MAIDFVGTFVSEDAYNPANEAAARFALFLAGTTTPIILGNLQTVTITDFSVSCDTDLEVNIFDGADLTIGDGELIHRAYVRNFCSVSAALVTWHTCQKGTYPKLVAAGSGNVAATIRGYIDN
jgi:hypothetical protein